MIIFHLFACLHSGLSFWFCGKANAENSITWAAPERSANQRRQSRWVTSADVDRHVTGALKADGGHAGCRGRHGRRWGQLLITVLKHGWGQKVRWHHQQRCSGTSHWAARARAPLTSDLRGKRWKWELWWSWRRSLQKVLIVTFTPLLSSKDAPKRLLFVASFAPILLSSTCDVALLRRLLLPIIAHFHPRTHTQTQRLMVFELQACLIL